MRRALALLLLAACAPADAARERVLKQIDLPHDYYYRELYLPQLTSGPSGADFSPDGERLVYSMAGSLWIQRIGSDEARELTHANGYDYQPDWSPDGSAIVFTRYRDDAMELWAVEPEFGKERQLTRGGAVNVEPRFSPDGKRVAYVSTEGTGHFNLFVADYATGRIANPRRIVGQRKSAIARYYYSAHDHAINPAWSADGKSLYYLSNREVAHGTGDLWRVALDDVEHPALVLREETSWRLRPDVAPDGRRIVYTSHQGRQSHQLWLTTVDGEAPYPLTFGEFDATEPRWSPDGRRIAYSSNEGGDLALMVMTLPGGARQAIVAKARKYKAPRALLTIDVRGPSGAPLPARIEVVASDGRAYAPADRWLHADDGFDRARGKFERHYFHCPGRCVLEVPIGKATVTVTHGLGHRIARRALEVPAKGLEHAVALEPNPLPGEYGDWASADLHVHMNYGGHYRATPDTLAAQARAEGLDLVYDLVVNKEQRIPDVARFSPKPEQHDGVWLWHAQEFHTSYWGHLGLLGLDDHLLLPVFAAYRATALASPWPTNGAIADLAHAQHALVGYVHPFDALPDPDKDERLTNALPADVALGKVDYYEVVGFSDHRSSAEIWHRLLNLGFRVPAGAGTDAMTNYASLRGPVGMNRVFVQPRGERTPESMRDALKQGRTFATNGPLLGFKVEGKAPGDELALPAGTHELNYRASLRSIVPVDHFEVLFNGRVAANLKLLTGARTDADAEGTLQVAESGWLTLRAHADQAHPDVLDLYPYGETSPVYVTVGDTPPRSPDDAAFFARWVERLIADAAARTDYNDAREREDTLATLRAALARFEALRTER